jgi:hypothetical protein
MDIDLYGGLYREAYFPDLFEQRFIGGMFSFL